MKERRDNILVQNDISSFWIILIGLFTIYPNTSRWQYVRMIILVIAFAVEIMWKRKGVFDKTAGIFFSLLFVGIILSSISVLIIEHSINVSVVLHETIRLIMNSIMFILFAHKNCSYRHKYFICFVLVGLIFVVQILQSLNPSVTNDFIRRYYVDSDSLGHHLELSLESQRMNFRAGSFLVNPNICACAVVLCCPVFFFGLALQDYKKKSSIMIIISFISLVLTGSRTGLIVFGVIIAYLCFVIERNNVKRFVFFLAGIVVLFVFVFILLQTKVSVNYRSFNLSDGLNKSLLVKLTNLLRYFVTVNPLCILTGSLGGYSSALQVDAEWGYFFTYYGVIGIAWYIKFIKEIMKNTADYELAYKRLYVLSLILIGMTETLVMCMPVANLLFVLALTNTDYEINDKHKRACNVFV